MCPKYSLLKRKIIKEFLLSFWSPGLDDGRSLAPDSSIANPTWDDQAINVLQKVTSNN